MVDKVISKEKRPLHGIKQFVIMAAKRSLGEEMILHPVTPTALHPNPMHMVSACFPQDPAFWKKRSRLKARRGRYPKSSNKVNKGKKIIMGGSMTDVTHAAV